MLALTGTDPDRLKEEKARGITIDLGFAHWTTDEFAFSFVDVPGHERFVKNMLAGVGGIDAVVLVVAADESVMPQTREHFEICRLLGVPAGLIAITKADLADADTIELVAMEVRDLVAGSFLADAPVVALSARTGVGLAEFREALVALGRRSRSRSSSGFVRMPIDRAFSVKGFGTVVTGTLLSGRVGVDDELALLPGERHVKVRGVQVHGETAALGQAGQRVALNLGGIDLDAIGRGDSLLTSGTLTPTRMLDARLQVVSSVGALRHGARVRFHQGTSETLGRVAVAAVLGVDRPGRIDRPDQMAPGQGPVPPRCRAERRRTFGSAWRRQPSCLAGTDSSFERIRRRSRLRAASCWTRIRRAGPSALRRRASASSDLTRAAPAGTPQKIGRSRRSSPRRVPPGSSRSRS